MYFLWNFCVSTIFWRPYWLSSGDLLSLLVATFLNVVSCLSDTELTNKPWNIKATTSENVPLDMCLSAQSSQYSFSAKKKFTSLCIWNVPSEGPDRTARMRKLIWSFVGRTCVFWRRGSYNDTKMSTTLLYLEFGSSNKQKQCAHVRVFVCVCVYVCANAEYLIVLASYLSVFFRWCYLK